MNFKTCHGHGHEEKLNSSIFLAIPEVDRWPKETEILQASGSGIQSVTPYSHHRNSHG